MINKPPYYLHKYVVSLLAYREITYWVYDTKPDMREFTRRPMNISYIVKSDKDTVILNNGQSINKKILKIAQ